MRVYERVAEAYAERGGEGFFGLLGEGNIKLCTTLKEAHGMTMRTARHEQGAVAMADGYSRASRRASLAAVTAGPGLVNAGVSIASAARAGSPVLVFAGDAPRGDDGHFQAMDQGSWAAGLGVPFVAVNDPSDLEPALELVFATLELGSAVILSIPMDVQDLEVVTGATADPHPRPMMAFPSREEISWAAHLIATSERPLLLVGGGGLHAAAVVGELAHRVGMPMATTLRGIGLLHDDPLMLGVCGGFDTGPVAAAIRESDLLIAVGTSLSRYTTKQGALTRDRDILRIDVRHPVRTQEREAFLTGDSAAVVGAIVEELRESRIDRGADHARERIVAAQREEYTYDPVDGGSGIDPRSALRAIDRAIGHPRHVSLDGGHFTTFAAGMMSWHDPSEMLFGLDFGAIGQGLLLALGAAASVIDDGREARVVAIVGDGGFLMNLQELETAVRLEVPLTVVVLNDEAYGQEVHMLEMYGLDPAFARISTPDLAAVARALGAAGARVETLDDLEAALEEQTAEPVRLLDVRIDGSVRNWRVEEMLRGHAVGTAR